MAFITVFRYESEEALSKLREIARSKGARVRKYKPCAGQAEVIFKSWDKQISCLPLSTAGIKRLGIVEATNE